ncbi:MAG: cardiolipin synthase [Muribaculaceae bacterium]|nr:cardiolipin synthase [Muribaculaceae bacterium]
MFLAELFPYADIVYNVFLVLYFLTVLTVIVVVLSENRNPVKSMAWVLVLLLLPVVGLVIYLIFGRSLKGISLISRSHLRELRRMHNPPEYDPESVTGLSEESQQLISLTSKLSRPHLFVGNNIDVFTTGKEKFEALMRDIREARHYIHVQYFIIEDDKTGSEFLALLMEKAREGVQVKVLYDYVGSFYFRPRVLRRMREAGIDVHPFLKLTFTQFANRVNWRNHRKIVVIDGKFGYLGGMNMADRYVIGDKNWAPWRDTHLRIHGEAVAALQYSFAIDWDFTTRELLNSTTMHYDTAPASRDYLVQMMTSGPTNRWNNISFVFLKAITLAKRCVYIQSPYFLPSDSLLKALQSAALAGVDVRLMIPRQSDSAMLRLATGSYYKECLLSGIKIYLYEPTIMHAKVVIVDDEFVTAGSTNFDFRSFEHNFEVNTLVYSKEFNEKMKGIFESDMEQCTRLLLSKWKQRPLMQKALESIVRLISPIL